MIRVLGCRPPNAVRVQFLVEFSDRSVRRKRLCVAAPIEEDLRLAVAERVYVNSKSRRPVVVEHVELIRTAKLLLVPPQAGVDCNETIDSPVVVAVDRMVALSRVHLDGTKETLT